MRANEETAKHLKLIFGYLNVLKDSISKEDKKWMVDAIEGELRTLFGHYEDIQKSDLAIEEQNFLIQPLLKDVIHSLSGELKRKAGIIDYQPLEETIEVIGPQSAVRQAIKNVLEEEIKTLKEGKILTVNEKIENNKLVIKVGSGGETKLTLELSLAPKGSEIFFKEFEEELKLPTLRGRGAILFSISGLDDLGQIYGEKRIETFLSTFLDKLSRTLRKGDRVISDGEGNVLVIVRNVDDASHIKSITNRLRKFVQSDIEPPLDLKVSFEFMEPDKILNPVKLLQKLKKAL